MQPAWYWGPDLDPVPKFALKRPKMAQLRLLWPWHEGMFLLHTQETPIRGEEVQEGQQEIWVLKKKY